VPNDTDKLKNKNYKTQLDLVCSHCGDLFFETLVEFPGRMNFTTTTCPKQGLTKHNPQDVSLGVVLMSATLQRPMLPNSVCQLARRLVLLAAVEVFARLVGACLAAAAAAPDDQARIGVCFVATCSANTSLKMSSSYACLVLVSLKISKACITFWNASLASLCPGFLSGCTSLAVEFTRCWHPMSFNTTKK
jgi:hypothetical protein